jgi:hypothetical protein
MVVNRAFSGVDASVLGCDWHAAITNVKAIVKQMVLMVANSYFISINKTNDPIGSTIPTYHVKKIFSSALIGFH